MNFQEDVKPADDRPSWNVSTFSVLAFTIGLFAQTLPPYRKFL